MSDATDTIHRSRLDRVSLTGADDQTALADLQRLGREFPFVEWALLYVPHAEGKPRNPTRAWREQFFSCPPAGHSAVHLCGRIAFEELLQGRLPRDVLGADRLQLNINARGADFTESEVLRVFDKALELGPSVILQYHAGTAGLINQFLSRLSAAQVQRVHVLLDESRGTGLTPAEWRIPKGLNNVFCGFAGGLGPHNVSPSLVAMEQCGQHYWADMESGVRTDNALDLAKASAVLAACAQHRRAPLA